MAPAHRRCGRNLADGLEEEAVLAAPTLAGAGERPGCRGEGRGEEAAAGDCADGKGLPTDPIGLAGEGAAKPAPAPVPAAAGLGCCGDGCGRLAGLGWRTDDAGGGLCRNCCCCWLEPPAPAEDVWGDAGVRGLLGGVWGA